MKRDIISVAVLAFGTYAYAAPSKPALDTARIEQLTGAKGKLDEKEGVFKVSVPRTDLKIVVGKVKMTPPMGLTSWAAFQKAHGKTMVMGEMVLMEDQVNPVMSTALEGGLEVTALHNHFFGDSPKVMFMHIGGMGDEEALATAVGKVFAKIQDTERQHVAGGATHAFPTADIDGASSSMNPAKIDEVFGKKGELNKGIYKVTFGRKTKMHGAEAGSTMGVNTWAAFAGSDDKAVVDGDFAMTETELQGVLKALRAADINVVAIHNHMTTETPRIMFLHFWGIGRTTDLARGIKSALDTQKM
jgi:hypothetical protein